MKPLRILVTDVQELAGLGAVRSLGRAGHIVTAVHTSGFHPAAINSRWCKNSMGYPDPWKFHMQFREWLINELETGKYDAVLPTAEAAIFAVKEIRDQFPQDIIKILPNDEHLKLTLSKFHANKTAKNAGLTTPKTIFVFDGKNECDGDLSSLGFPVIIKTDNSLTSEGTYIKGRTVRVNSQEEADLIFEECKALGCSVIAQEPVKGSGVGVFLLRWNGKTILKFAHQRLHEVPWTGGASSFRKSVHDNELIDLSEKFLESIDYQGAAMIEFRRDGTEGVPYFMEINGRLWGSIALCLHAGLDFPKTLVDCESQGEPESPINKQKSYPSNLKCRNLSGEINYVSSVLKSKSGPSKTKTILEFFALSLNPLVKYDYFWWSDPMPALVQAYLTSIDILKGFKNRIKSMFVSRKTPVTPKLTHFESKPNKILFICHGNICRSAFAEFYWNKNFSKSGVKAISAGLCKEMNRPVPLRAQSIANVFGLDLSGHKSKSVTKEIIDECDLIFVMDTENYEGMLDKFPHSESKLIFLGSLSGEKNIEISDPCRKCPMKFDPIEAKNIFDRIINNLNLLNRYISNQS